MTQTVVTNYFNDRASQYERNAGRWPWRWLREREASALLSAIGNVRDLEVLELGCGAGFYTRRLLNAGATHVFAVDLSPDMVGNLPTTGVTGIVGDASTVQLDRNFEIIVAAGLMEFVDHPQVIMANARRIATATTRLNLLLPHANLAGRLYRMFHRSHGMNINLFTPAIISELAAQTAWRVTDMRRVPPFTLVATLEPA